MNGSTSALQVLGLEPEPERGVEAVDHVQVVRPGLGPVLPRMGRRVRADEPARPVGGRAVLVVRLQRSGVVRALVAEEYPARLEPARIPDEAVPVVVADLVPEMTEERPIRLTQIVADLLALRVVRLFGVERDQAARVPGQHARPRGRCAQEIEREPALRVLAEPRPHRQAEREELRDETALRHLDRPPVALVVGVGEIRDRAVEAAGDAVVARVLRRHQPVAARRRVEVRALPVLARRVGQPPSPRRAPRLERRQHAPIGRVAERRGAAEAEAVAEEDVAPAPAAEGARVARRARAFQLFESSPATVSNRFSMRRPASPVGRTRAARKAGWKPEASAYHRAGDRRVTTVLRDRRRTCRRAARGGTPSHALSRGARGRRQSIFAYAGSVRKSTYSPVVSSSKSFAACSYLPACHASSPR